jgi:two-component system chemotaxis response regulator CheY
VRDLRDAAGIRGAESAHCDVGPILAAEERPLREVFQRGSNLRKVLIVDDSVSIRQMIGFALRRGGYEVIEAENGCDALNKLATATVDLVLTDLNMPEMDGVALIRALRKQTAMKNKPILMLTTEALGTQQEKDGRAAGATGWIVKPVDSAKLLQTLAKVLPQPHEDRP